MLCKWMDKGMQSQGLQLALCAILLFLLRVINRYTKAMRDSDDDDDMTWGTHSNAVGIGNH